MSKGIKVRCIGGPAGGQEILVLHGETFRVPEHPDMVTCPSCAGADIYSEPEPIHSTTYKIQMQHFDSGHKHAYAIPEKNQLVSAFNEMWHEYKESMRMKN